MYSGEQPSSRQYKASSSCRSSLTWSTQCALLSHGCGNEHWNASAMIDPNAQAVTIPSRMRLHSTVRLSDIMLWRRYESDTLAMAMEAMSRICAAYSYWGVGCQHTRADERTREAFGACIFYLLVLSEISRRHQPLLPAQAMF